MRFTPIALKIFNKIYLTTIYIQSILTINAITLRCCGNNNGQKLSFKYIQNQNHLNQKNIYSHRLLQ